MAFGSSTLRVHLLRGAIGLAALAIALRLGSSHLWLSVALVPLAIWLLRGCPMCWTIGLFETAARCFLARQEELPARPTKAPVQLIMPPRPRR